MKTIIQGFVSFLTLNGNWKPYKPGLRRRYQGKVEVSKKAETVHWHKKPLLSTHSFQQKASALFDLQCWLSTHSHNPFYISQMMIKKHV